MRKTWLAGLAVVALVGCGAETQVAISDGDSADEANVEGAVTGRLPVGSTLQVVFNASLRRGPTSSSTKVAALPVGTLLTTTAELPQGNNYYAVTVQGLDGFVYGGNVRLVAVADAGTDSPVDAGSPAVVDAGRPVDPDPTPTSVVVDLRADTNRSGAVELDDPTEDADENTWTTGHGAVFLANIDDDSSRCRNTSASDVDLPKCNDAQDDVVNGSDDILDLAPLKVAPWAQAPEGTTATLSFEPAARVRVFKLNGGRYELVTSGAALPLADLRAGASLFLEGKDIVRDSQAWNGLADVTLRVTVPASAGAVAGSYADAVRLKIAPMLTFNHTQPVTTAFVSNTGGADSTDFIRALRPAVTAAGVPGGLVELSTGDQWAQDFFETGYMSMPGRSGQQVMLVFLRSANLESRSSTSPLREAGRLVFTTFRGKDRAGVQQFDFNAQAESQSLNSFGNLETVPPFSFNGRSFPFGRVIRGSIPSFHPDPSFVKMIESQKAQAQIFIDTQWLAVGHVDETLSFIKVNTPRGWAVLANDARMAKAMLQQAVSQGYGSTRLFINKAWLNDSGTGEVSATKTISQVLADTDVMAASNEAAVKVDEQIAILKAETGITDAEIIHVPFLHMTSYGSSIAYNPGTVNMLNLNANNVVVPDPFGPVIGGKDIFKDQLERALAPYQVRVHWVDDWDLYHRLMGEIHCGTNSVRQIPSTKWWEVLP